MENSLVSSKGFIILNKIIYIHKILPNSTGYNVNEICRLCDIGTPCDRHISWNGYKELPCNVINNITGSRELGTYLARSMSLYVGRLVKYEIQ